MRQRGEGEGLRATISQASKEARLMIGKYLASWVRGSHRGLAAGLAATLVVGASGCGEKTMGPAAGTQSVTMVATKDNTLFEDPDGVLSSGAGPLLYAGKTNADMLRRALLQFDVAGNVPAGATIVSARLEFTISSATGASPETFTIHRVLASWGEGTSDSGTGGIGGGGGGGGGAPSTVGDATWIHRFYDTILWTTPGGDFDAEPSATKQFPIDGHVTVGSTAGLVADVQGWLDGTFANDGWLVKHLDEVQKQTARRIGSRENVSAEDRPMLVVEYKP
jgi:hypothetical protein